jgi:hypothetical protein
MLHAVTLGNWRAVTVRSAPSALRTVNKRLMFCRLHTRTLWWEGDLGERGGGRGGGGGGGWRVRWGRQRAWAWA